MVCRWFGEEGQHSSSFVSSADFLSIKMAANSNQDNNYKVCFCLERVANLTVQMPSLTYDQYELLV